MTDTLFTPWSTAAPLFQGGAPSWVPEEHQERIRAYELYEAMYWQVPQTFKLMARGQQNTMPIYIPNPRTIIDTSARYVAKELGFTATVNPDPTPTEPAGTDADAALAHGAFTSLFRRERWWSRFAANKLYGLMRGDYLWHLYANPLKPEGRRITVQTVHPGHYYPIYDDITDPNSLRAVILADLVTMPDGKQFVRRQRYTKITNDDGTNIITTELAYFKTDKWFPRVGEDEPEPESVPNVQVIAPTPLDPAIQAIPVYHVQNNPANNAQFGNSELRGIERVVAAVNQSISDEDLVLVLEGLGVYATDAGPPVDEEGNEINWMLGPGRVLELNSPEARFMRVNGVSTVGPFQDHIKYLERKLDDATGANEAARGQVDVQVAESGIALALRLSPLLARVEYMETFITDVLVQMWFDLQTGWLPVYESQQFPGILLQPTYGNKLPTNRKEKFAELLAMLAQGIIDDQFVRDEMQQFGYVFPTDMGQRALAATQARTQAATPTDALSGAQPSPNGQTQEVPA